MIVNTVSGKIGCADNLSQLPEHVSWILYGKEVGAFAKLTV